MSLGIDISFIPSMVAETSIGGSNQRLAGRSHLFSGQSARLLHPSGELRFVNLIVLVNIEVAHFLLLGLARRDRTERRAEEERHLHILREAMKAEKPALALDSVERRVPFHRLVHVRNGARDQRVDAAPNV